MNILRRTFLNALLLQMGGISCVAMAAGQQQTVSYTFMVVPQFAPSQLHREWYPLIERISQKSGVRLELKIPASIPEFEATFMKGGPDFAFMNPYHAVMAKRAQGYKPLIRNAEPLNGILVVRRDSSIKSIQDLDQKVIGFPSPNAFGASLYMRALLAEKFKINFEANYLKTHSNVFRHVAQGSVEAGGTVNATLDDTDPSLREQLRVLYQTPDVPPHPVVVHPRVPQSVSAAITEAFLALQSDEEGRNLLKEIRVMQPIKSNYEQDYFPLESLRLQKYLVLEKK